MVGVLLVVVMVVMALLIVFAVVPTASLPLPKPLSVPAPLLIFALVPFTLPLVVSEGKVVVIVAEVVAATALVDATIGAGIDG